jgi:hypothetical protein
MHNIFFFYSEDRASWYILIMEANEMHYFSNLFHKVLYMFRTSPLSIISSISTLYTQQYAFVMLADANRTSTTNTCCCVYSVEILLIMDSGSVRNMWSTLLNKCEKQCISLASIIRNPQHIYMNNILYVVNTPTEVEEQDSLKMMWVHRNM